MSTRSRNWIKFGALVALAFVLGLFFAGLLDFPRAGIAQERAAHTPIVRVDAPHIPAARPLVDLSDAYAAVVDAVRPSVVYVQAESPVSQDSAPDTRIFGQLPPGFQQLIPRQQQRRRNNAEPELEHSSGSGFIVSNDGYILTNNHVISGSSKVTVRLLDGREYVARIVGTDKDTDVGVLKIDATGLTPAALGSSDNTRVGEWVLAIGNPLGEELTFTVTSGIVSAKGRAQLQLGDRDGGRVIQDYIQTDAVINRGNSGGPLINMHGEVIGINAAIASTTGSYTGYAFAVPIDLARKVMDQLISRGRVERAGMGITVKDASADDAAYLGLPSISGVLVASLTEGSPAQRAGIQAGDVIVAIDGQPVRYTSQLQQNVGFRHPGDVVKVDVMRKDGKHTFDVKLTTIGEAGGTELKDAVPAPQPSNNTDATGTIQSRLGIVVDPVTPATAAQYGLPAGTRGLAVRHIIDGSPSVGKFVCPIEFAAQCGSPDVITEVEGRPVTTEQELKAALGNAVHGVITIRVIEGVGQDNKTQTRIERIRLR